MAADDEAGGAPEAAAGFGGGVLAGAGVAVGADAAGVAAAVAVAGGAGDTATTGLPLS